MTDALPEIAVDPETTFRTEPERIDPATFPENMRTLYDGVRAALAALPGYFQYDNSVGGIDATDLHNLNTLMGAAIEVQVVEALNGMRNVWDSDREWTEYSFVRSSQAFPDVRLVRRTDDGLETVFGVELKGWFLFAKEGEPSLRYKVAPDACNPWDLVCVVPWYLNNAVAGKAEVGTPWVEQARYAAEWRDYWWEFVRDTKDVPGQRGVRLPDSAAPYPKKADLVSVVPIHDGGDNFGRLPRCKPLMNSFLEAALDQPVLGIPARDWQVFLQLHKDTADPAEVLYRVIQTKRKKRAEEEAEIVEAADELRALLLRIQKFYLSDPNQAKSTARAPKKKAKDPAADEVPLLED